MNSYAVFLRGINIGGVTIKMADLRKALSEGPFSKVKTLLASGNVVLASELDSQAVKAAVEAKLRESFGYDAWVVVLEAERVAELVEACPFPADDKSTHSYVTLASDAAMLDELSKAAEGMDGVRLLRLGSEAIAWLAPAGGTLESPFSKLSSKPRYKSTTTTRNLRTLIKVRDAAAVLQK
ncbi:DUF1697 domain-containing protein [Arthrobacter sp. M4]|uniref:DUF1697 domain-containing protein n=1 Tax=Arthrobacter sp. M4 TaxID=218160 RepID=UPI001CDB7CAD|nr:DUF1697 domain-containing protein [Arthrobacter sp. M4]MCA4132092.1 DUF1697 domain-containing protein [Arthrobacter sp. M4]